MQYASTYLRYRTYLRVPSNLPTVPTYSSMSMRVPTCLPTYLQYLPICLPTVPVLVTTGSVPTVLYSTVRVPLLNTVQHSEGPYVSTCALVGALNFLMPDAFSQSAVYGTCGICPGVPPTVHMVLEYRTPEYVPWSSSVGIISTVNSASLPWKWAPRNSSTVLAEDYCDP